MAFKKMTEYNEEKFGNFFRLVNDKDWADVIFPPMRLSTLAQRVAASAEVTPL